MRSIELIVVLCSNVEFIEPSYTFRTFKRLLHLTVTKFYVNHFQPLYYGAARLTFGQNADSVSTSTSTTTTPATTTTTTTIDDTSDENSSHSSETVSNNGAKRSGKGPKVLSFVCRSPFFRVDFSNPTTFGSLLKLLKKNFDMNLVRLHVRGTQAFSLFHKLLTFVLVDFVI